MSTISIQPIVLSSGSDRSTGQLCLSRHGTYMARTAGKEFELRLSVVGGKEIPSAPLRWVTSTLLRTFRRETDDNGVELLCTVSDTREVYRWDIQEKAVRKLIDTGLDGSEILCLKESGDGRYIAIGDSTGHLQVWNLDQANNPVKVLDWQQELQLTGNIAELAFSRSNKELVLATTAGELYLIDIFRETVVELSSEVRWPCYTVAWHPETSGIAFGGEDGQIWMLNVPCPYQAEFSADDVPFGLSQYHTYTGESGLTIAAMPGARVNLLKSRMGMISQLSFLNASSLCVRGERGVEVLDLSSCQVSRLAYHPHNRDHRSLSMAAHAGKVWLAREQQQ
jgi:WD40 repeat protein